MATSDLKVQNIVATASLGKEVSLTKLARSQSNTEYNPEQFPGLVYKLVEPTATFLLFSNGKLVCTGTKNKQQLDDSMEQLNKNIRAAVKESEK
jgi:transcription initiation factor TFIID TATA-box-binding protein